LDKSDCYYCMTNVNGINKIYKGKIVYASVSSVQRSQIKVVEGFEDKNSRDSFIQRLDAMQVDEDPEEQCENPDVQRESLAKESELVAEVESETDESEEELCSDTEEKYVPVGREQNQKKTSQSQLNDMFRRVGLLKDATELMASEMKAFNVLEKNVNVTFYRNREKAFRKYFTGESNIVYCTDVKGLIDEFKPNLY